MTSPIFGPLYLSDEQFVVHPTPGLADAPEEPENVPAPEAGLPAPGPALIARSVIRDQPLPAGPDADDAPADRALPGAIAPARPARAEAVSDITGNAAQTRLLHPAGDGWPGQSAAFPVAAGDTFRTIDASALDPSVGFVILGAEAGDMAGYDVANAGDVNGDGIDDLIVGAPAGLDNTGAAYIVYGLAGTGRVSVDLSNLSASEGFVIAGDRNNDKAGWSVSFAGDVNGDGIDDVIIGARNGDDGAQNAGEAYVIYGQTGTRSLVELSSLAAGDGFILQGISANDQTGYNVSYAGDVNGDGIDDLVVGALGGTLGGELAGQSYVVYGQTGDRGTVDFADLAAEDGYIIQGIEGIRAGSVAGGGDVNGDGLADVIVGAHRGLSGGVDSGEVYIVYGQTGTRGTLDLATFGESDGFIIQGDEAQDYLGLNVAAAGDVNGDGIDDIIAGAFRGDDGGNNAGEAYVIYGQAGPRGTVDLTGLDPADGFIIQGDAEGDLAGISVAAAGDINGDGIDDVIVGARYGDDGGINAGEAYVIYGKAGDTHGTIDLSDLDPGDGFIVAGATDGATAGRSVSGAGDVNGDGIDDLIVGAPGGNGGTGEAYVIYGFRNPPEATLLSGTVEAVAGEALALDLSALVITDIDATSDMSVTLTATGGTLAAEAGGGVAVALSDAGQVLTLTGTLEDLNAYLAVPGNVGYTARDDAAPQETITVTLDDLDGSGPVVAGEIGVEIANRAPEATGLPGTVEAVAGEALAMDLSALVISDIDATGDMSVTLTATGGTLAAEAGGGVAVALSDAGQVLTLTGTLEDLNAYLAVPGIVGYTARDDAAPQETITVTLDDLDGSGPVAAGEIGVEIAVPEPVILALGGGGAEIEGAAGDDILSATSGANVISGGDGDDLIGGGFDGDTLFGRAGNDILLGDNSDIVAGADRLVGGTGDDLLEGGGGADTFVFGTGDGADTIGKIVLDHDDAALSFVQGPDFVSGVDLIELVGFDLADGAAALALVSDVNGVATFAASGTTITFAGLAAADLSADDFLIL